MGAFELRMIELHDITSSTVKAPPRRATDISSLGTGNENTVSEESKGGRMCDEDKQRYKGRDELKEGKVKLWQKAGQMQT